MNDSNVLALRAVYVANVFVAGYVGMSSLFTPEIAGRTVFSGTASPGVPMRIVGCLWLSIAAVSVLGLVYPVMMSPVLLIQLIYKGLWLLVVALPALMKGERGTLPGGMAIFFLIWVLVLPFVIPYRSLFLPEPRSISQSADEPFADHHS